MCHKLCPCQGWDLQQDEEGLSVLCAPGDSKGAGGRGAKRMPAEAICEEQHLGFW